MTKDKGPTRSNRTFLVAPKGDTQQIKGQNILMNNMQSTIYDSINKQVPKKKCQLLLNSNIPITAEFCQ